MKSLMTDFQKLPGQCQSLKKTSVTIFNKALLIAYDSTAQDLDANIHYNGNFQTKNESSLTKRFFAETSKR